MPDLLFIPIAILYLIVVGLLFAYGINFFYMTYVALRGEDTPGSPPPPKDWPRVTVQLPIYNEMYVAERLIRAAAALDYPAHLLEIQVLDDSTDGTHQLVTEVVTELQADGLQIYHLHRRDRRGYKAGALKEGTRQARGEFMAIFDADFIPLPAFLKQTIPHFQNPQVAFVQTRWGHLNSEYSFLTFLQSLAIDAHFMVEQFARSRRDFWFNFNGTAGVWRREAVVEAGGWQAETLTEDLDLSYRAFFSGWKAVYLRDVEVPAEIPASFTAYRRQQHRWARGSLECAQKYLPRLWSARIPLRIKIGASLHLTGYGVHLLLLALSILYPMVLLLSQRYHALISLFGIAAIFNATAFAPTVFFLVAQRTLGRNLWKYLPRVLFMTALGAGMMVNTARAALQILMGGRAAFERTPKFGLVAKSQSWKHRRYQLGLDPLVFVEFPLALFNLATCVLAINLNNAIIAIYAALFSCGLFFTAGLSISQAISVHRVRNSSPTADQFM